MLRVFQIAKAVFRYAIPPRYRYPLARLLARAALPLDKRRRQILIDNLTPLVGAERAGRVAPVAMGHFLMTAVDFFCPRPHVLRDIEASGFGKVEKAWRRHQRVVLVTAHLGNWEIGMSYLVERGFSVAGVYAPYREDAIVRWILAHRNQDVEWIPSTRGAAEACVYALQRGRVLGMVADIPFGEKGRRVSLAGRHARLPLGPWAIADRAQAVVFPCFFVRQTPGRYRLFVHDPIQSAGGSLRRRLETMQDAYASVLEQYLREYPEQWGVLQPFWES